jgi:3-hydroxybutyryl-CoA dehydratase
MPSPSNYSFAEIVEGMTVERDYTLTRSVYEAFLAAFDDRSSVHVDDDYAKASGFRERVMHGAILNGFLSNFVGMHFPGRRALWLSVDLRYLAPTYLDDQVKIEAVVAQKVESQQVLVLNIVVRNVTQGILTARGRLQVTLRDD